MTDFGNSIRRARTTSRRRVRGHASHWLPFRRDLGLQLLALYLLFVGPVIAAALIFDSFAGVRLQRDVKAADLALAQSIALETDASLQNALHTVAQLSLTPEVQSADLARLAALFGPITTGRSEINLIYLLDANGIMLYHYPEGPGSTVGTDFSFREYFQEALISREPLMSIGRISPTTEQPVATAVMPVRGPDGEFRGLVATNLALQHLSTTLGQIAASSTGGLRVSILDSSGQIVADADPERLLSDARNDVPAEVAAVLGGASAATVGRDQAGREWLRSYVPISSAGWGVLVQRPADLAFASLRAFHGGLLVAISVFLIGGLFFWSMLSRRVIAPLEHLAAFSASIGQRAVAPSDRAHLTALSTRPDQMGHLIRSITRMEQDIERRFTEVATLLDTSTAVVSTLDSERVLDTILEQVRRLLDVNTCAIVALDQRAGEFRIRASRGLSADYAHRVRILPTEPTSPSMRAIRTGRPVQVSDTESEPDFHPMLRERARTEGYRSLVAAPLVARHAPAAALLIYRRDPHRFSPEEINLIANFANHASMAIENAALFALSDEKLREQTRILEAIVQSLNDGLILESPDGRVLYANRRICELADIAPEAVPTQNAAALRARLLTRPAVDRPPSARASAASPGNDGEITLLHQGRLLDLRLESFDVTDERGQLIGRGQLWLDVTRDKELDRMRSALIATVSHELRTPLAAIKGNLSSLLADDVIWDAEAEREFLQVALTESDRLSALVTDLLDLSQIEAGTLVVRREPCTLRELVSRAAARARPGERLRLDLPPSLPILHADPARIEAVLRNLIENAVKYSPPDSPIRLSAEQVDGHFLVRVSNTGPGISPEHREKIFDRFYRINSGLTRPTGGAGLGLAICRGFVQAHGGRIWVEPREAGAEFAFTLPL
ncbi:MAG: ATP-binding protein [Ardenticatenaceae bacterium]|nr:ATP-binding protein [Ardenticatenaceae bacterium]HBY94205.1 hypothetical protein [Chloroflexota bacterium]